MCTRLSFCKLSIHKPNNCSCFLIRFMVIQLLCLQRRRMDRYRIHFSYFPYNGGNKRHNRRSIENSQYFRLCSSSNTTVKKSMHHIQLEKQGPGLQNTLTHNRSQIKNDNPLNGAPFLGVSGGCSWRERVKNNLCLADDSYLVFFTARQNQLLKS